MDGLRRGEGRRKPTFLGRFVLPLLLLAGEFLRFKASNLVFLGRNSLWVFVGLVISAVKIEA